MSKVLSGEHLGKRYGSFCALKDCTFTFDQGRVTALIGPNGAGKSTLLELAIGLLAPTEGTIEVLGVSLFFARGNSPKLQNIFPGARWGILDFL